MSFAATFRKSAFALAGAASLFAGATGAHALEPKQCGTAAEMTEALKAEGQMICPLLSGPISILELATKEEWNGKEAQAGGDHRQAA